MPLRIVSDLEISSPVHHQAAVSVPGSISSGEEVSSLDWVSRKGDVEVRTAHGLKRSTSRSSKLCSMVVNERDNLAACVAEVYQPVVQRSRRWSRWPVDTPPLEWDRQDGEFTYLQTKLYPHLSF
jgi:hypothetical protein